MTSALWPGSVIEPLSTEECLRLLRQSAPLGRVAVTAGALPVVLPVLYAVADGSVIFPVDPRSRLAEAAAGAVVAFQVDAFDPATLTGWSVLAVGVGHRVTEPGRLRELSQAPPCGQPVRAEAPWIEVAGARLSGRRLVGAGPPAVVDQVRRRAART